MRSAWPAAGLGLALLVCVGLAGLVGQVPPTVSTILMDGKPITATTLNLMSGPSIIWICSPVGASQLNCQSLANTATLVSKATLQSGACQFINSTDGSKSYTYAMGPTCQTLQSYVPGARFWLKTVTPCPADCSLNIDKLGQLSIKQSDGSTDPGGLFDFTRGVPIWFDGKLFRIECQH